MEKVAVAQHTEPCGSCENPCCIINAHLVPSDRPVIQAVVAPGGVHTHIYIYKYMRRQAV